MDATTVARTLAAGVGVGAALSCVLSSERELAVLLRTATAAVVLPRRTAPTTIAATEPATEPHWLRPLRASLPLTERVTYFQNGGHGPPPNGVLQAAADHAATAAHYCAPPPPPSGSPAFKAASLGSDGSAAVTADARLALGRLIGCGRPVESLALLSSTTQALQYVLGSLPWVPGDELIISNLEHVCVAAMCQGLEAERGVRIRCVCADRGDRFFTRELQASLSPHTRLVLLSHVSSCTGHVLPVAQAMALVAAAERYSAFEGGARTLIDGAQAVGQLEVDVDSLGCDYYVGSGHKWLCAPTGTAFVYAAPRVLPEFGPFPTAPVGAWPDHAAQPTTAAARAERGTADGSTHAGLREALRMWERLGLPEVRAHTTRLASHLKAQVAAGTLPGVRVLTPLGSARSTGLVVLAFDALPLPEEVAAAAEGGGSRRARLQLAAAPAPMAPNLLRHLVYTLYAKYSIVVKFQYLETKHDRHTSASADAAGMRVSVGMFNTMEEVESLLSALRTELPRMRQPHHHSVS